MPPVKLPVVLLPGLLCDTALWEAQIAALGDIAECWVADLTRDDSMGGMASRVLAESPFDTFALAGFSMGGFVAFEVLRRARQRVSRLALMDTSAWGDTQERREERERFIELARQPKGFAPISRATLPAMLPPSRMDDAPLVEAVRQMAERVGAEAFVRQQRAILARQSSEADLAGISVPTLVLCGDLDVRTPLQWHRDMAARIPGARLEVIADCGHMVTMERPAEVNAALRAWLTN